MVGEDEYCLHIEAYADDKSLCELLIAKGWARAATTYACDRDERDYLLDLQKKSPSAKAWAMENHADKIPHPQNQHCQKICQQHKQIENSAQNQSYHCEENQILSQHF